MLDADRSSDGSWTHYAVVAVVVSQVACGVLLVHYSHYLQMQKQLCLSVGSGCHCDWGHFPPFSVLLLRGKSVDGRANRQTERPIFELRVWKRIGDERKNVGKHHCSIRAEPKPLLFPCYWLGTTKFLEHTRFLCQF